MLGDLQQLLPIGIGLRLLSCSIVKQIRVVLFMCLYMHTRGKGAYEGPTLAPTSVRTRIIALT